MIVKIDHDIPLPPGLGKLAKYPFKDLKPGDSFFIVGEGEDGSDEKKKFRQRIGVAVSQKLGRGGGAVRAVTEGGVSGYRVWRLK